MDFNSNISSFISFGMAIHAVYFTNFPANYSKVCLYVVLKYVKYLS
jgi:hypothetical protein